MTPPEPDPPEPTVPEYTYSASYSISLGSVTGILYRSIQYNGSDCKITGSVNDVSYDFNDLILYEVDDTKYCYFARGSNPVNAILGNNAEIGLTVPYYEISAGSVSQSGTVYVESSTPSDYFENVRTRNFTLVQRS